MMNVAKKVFQFSLILKNVDDKTSGLEDSLYESGCDDALINFRNGTVYLDFDREASSLKQAVLKAILDVESASIGAIVASVCPENLVTESDIAKRVNVNRQTVSLWINGSRRKSKPFPKPIMKLADRSPFWNWNEVASWLYGNKIITDETEVENATILNIINMALINRDEKQRKETEKLRKQLGQIEDNDKPRPKVSRHQQRGMLKKAG
jgi:transcriptional regulator with XRE-family HTH domain